MVQYAIMFFIVTSLYLYSAASNYAVNIQLALSV